MQEIVDAMSLAKSKIIFASCNMPNLAFNTFKDFRKDNYYQYTDSRGMYHNKLINSDDMFMSVSGASGAVDYYSKVGSNSPMLLVFTRTNQLELFRDSLEGFRSSKNKSNLKLIVFCDVALSNEFSDLGIVIDVNKSTHYLDNFLYEKKELLTESQKSELGKTNISSLAKAHYRSLVKDDYLEQLFKNLKQVNSSSFLSFIDPNPNLYGLDSLKQWVLNRKHLIHGEHPVPLKGISLIGIPGVGKSKSAGYISHLLEVPAYSFNVLSCLNRYVGNSEANVISALNDIESLGNCVILLDEVDKIFSRTDDEGTSSRLLSLILRFMDDNDKAFWVVTGNVVDKIPPELLRKGRLNEYFYIGLPTEKGIKEYIQYRADIFSKYDMNLTEKQIDDLVDVAIKNKLLFNDIVTFMDDIYINSTAEKGDSYVVPLSSYLRHRSEFNKILEWSKDNAKSAI